MFDLSKLGVKQNIPKVNFTDYTGIFVCPPKFGKTTMASMFPKAIIVPFEKGFSAQVVNYVEDMNTWEDFISFVNKLEEEREGIADNIQTIVFDTVNEAYDLCLPYMLKMEGKKASTKYTAINELPFGVGWSKLDLYFKTQIDRILKLGFAILFISHSKVKNIKPKDGEPYDVYSSTMSDRLEKIIYPLVDYIVFGEKRKVLDTVTGNTILKRVMLVSGSSNSNETGSRVALNTDIVFDTEEEAVDKFQQHFQNAIAEKLKKAGIKTTVEALSEKQAKEKQDKVLEYIKTQKQPTNEELVKLIQDKFMSANKETKLKMQSVMEEYKISSFANAESLSSEGLQKIADLLK